LYARNTDAEDEDDDNKQHEAEDGEEEEAAIGLHPASLHRTTESLQHPVVDVDSDRDVHHAV